MKLKRTTLKIKNFSTYPHNSPPFFYSSSSPNSVFCNYLITHLINLFNFHFVIFRVVLKLITFLIFIEDSDNKLFVNSLIIFFFQFNFHTFQWPWTVSYSYYIFIFFVFSFTSLVFLLWPSYVMKISN